MIQAKKTKDELYPRSSKPSFENIKEKCFHGFEVEQVQQPMRHIFNLGEVLGSGKQGVVYSANCKKQMCGLAIKVIDLGSQSRKERANNEIETLSFLKSNPHKNVIKFFGGFDESGYRYLVFERADMSLREFLKKHSVNLPVSQFNEIVFQLLEGLEYFNSIGLLYSDITFGNIAVSLHDKKLKYIDFEDSFKLTSYSCISPLEVLPRLGRLLKDVAFEDSSNNTRLSFGSDCKDLLAKNQLWSPKTSDFTKELLAKFFISEKHVQEEVVSNRFLFSPRDELTLP